MADNVSAEVRARTMRAVRGTNTTPELRLRRALWARGVRGYRVGPRAVLGQPDLAFTRLKLAVFVDGCYWHGCPEHCRRPSSNTTYWHAKIDRTIARDARTRAQLAADGWTVLTIWEHELKRTADEAVARVAAALAALGGPASADAEPKTAKETRISQFIVINERRQTHL